MWIMTPQGFVSIVRKSPVGLEVRARDRESLEDFCALARVSTDRIVEGGGTDYAFRIRRVAVIAVVRFVRAKVRGIEYSNFKDEAKRVRGSRYASALGKVWTAMWDLTPDDVYKRVYRRVSDADRTWYDEWRARQAGGSSIIAEQYLDADALEDLGMLDEFDDETRSMHSYTDDEWRTLMEENPGL